MLVQRLDASALFPGRELPCMLVLSYFLLFYDRKRGKRSEVRRMVFTEFELSLEYFFVGFYLTSLASLSKKLL